MKFLLKILSIIAAILFFGFAIKNTQDATINFFLGYEITKPIILLLTGFLLIGAILGVVGMLPVYVRQRRDLARHRKSIVAMQQEREAQIATRAQPPQPDSIVNN